MRRFAILSHVLPPSPSGQAVALYRILSRLDPGSYVLISAKDYRLAADTSPRLQARCRWVRPGAALVPYLRRGGGVLDGIGTQLECRSRAMAVARILREENCDCLVACTGDLLDLPAGYAASRHARIRFAAYLFDDYEHQWINRRARSHAERWAPTILRNASVVLVPNEFLQEEYYSRYGIRPAVVRNPSGLLATADAPPWPREPGRVRIVYTGAVYQAHYDAFRNLVAAIRLSHRGELELHIYTAQPFEELRREGILGPVVYHRHVDLADAEAAQRQADILFLPLAFTSPYPASIVRTSAPGKMGEYLASGRPVLVHAPPDSFVSWYFRHHMCGTVVDQDDPSALMEALCRMMDDEALRQTLARKGLERAREDFDPGKNLVRLLAALERGEQR